MPRSRMSLYGAPCANRVEQAGIQRRDRDVSLAGNQRRDCQRAIGEILDFDIEIDAVGKIPRLRDEDRALTRSTGPRRCGF